MALELEAEHDKLVGETLANRYLIEVRLGEGAMGAVYRAKHIKVGRNFAVKVLHPRLLEDMKVVSRFEREAELAGRLRHPNVIGVVDVGETPDGMRYMVMDFAEGPDLATLLSEAPMPPQRVIHLTRQLLEGLFHAHEHGLIHRDFKPENVIVEKDSHGQEVPRIVDFGIAILREGGESSQAPGRLTTNGLVLGTPHYMAPEQAVADPIDHRIDLFALGIMVYEMLSGKLPFDGTGAEVARANLLLDPPLISERVPYLEVDPLLEAFARRMMAKKRDLRPATAKVARDILDLIEKDRAAAAAALGVPLDAARAPMTTQPVQPIRHASGEGTYPPPVREAIETPAQTPNAARSSEHAIPTQQTDPIGARKRRAPLIGAVIVGVGIIAGAAVVVTTGDKKHDPARGAEQVALGADPINDGAPGTPAPPTMPSADTGSNVGSADLAMPAGSGSAAAPVEPTTAAGSAVAAIAPSGSGGETAVAPGAATVKKVAGKQTTTKTSSTKTTTASTTTTPHAVAEVKAEPKAIDSGTLALQYQAVGAQLNALEKTKGRDATTDLWQRYRYIRLSEAMATQPKRDEAAQILSRLTSEIASRKK